MQYLKYYEQNNGMLSTGFDIINGVATNIKFSAGKSAGTYFISATANLAKYMDINDRGYTYLTSHDFTFDDFRPHLSKKSFIRIWIFLK